jgi:hypothetical protein
VRAAHGLGESAPYLKELHMFPYQYLLAAALLTQSADRPGPELGPDAFFALRLPLMALATDWEILDPREVRYVLARPEDFTSDLNLLRRRCHDLATAPRIVDANRLPERALVNELLSFNRTYRQHIAMSQPAASARGEETRCALQETDRLYNIWDTVRDARCEYYYVTVRRQALKRLRELIGDEAYDDGMLPPHVPLWRFQEID